MRGAHLVTLVSLLMSAALAGSYFAFLYEGDAMSTAAVATTANMNTALPEGKMIFNPLNETGAILIIAVMVLLSLIVVLKRREHIEIIRK